jgi:hypothetical protein
MLAGAADTYAGMHAQPKSRRTKRNRNCCCISHRGRSDKPVGYEPECIVVTTGLILVCLYTKDSYRSGNTLNDSCLLRNKKMVGGNHTLFFLDHRRLRIMSDQIRAAFHRFTGNFRAADYLSSYSQRLTSY